MIIAYNWFWHNCYFRTGSCVILFESFWVILHRMSTTLWFLKTVLGHLKCSWVTLCSEQRPATSLSTMPSGLKYKKDMYVIYIYIQMKNVCIYSFICTVYIEINKHIHRCKYVNMYICIYLKYKYIHNTYIYFHREKHNQDVFSFNWRMQWCVLFRNNLWK